MKVNQIICGDNMEVMATFPDNCIPTIITDPPYGLGFMGKTWDTFTPANIASGVTRSSRKIPCDNPEARAKGSAALEAGRYDHSRNAEFQQWFTIWGIEALRILKPGGTMLIFGGTRTYHRLACAIEDAGFVIKDCLMWLYGSGFPKAMDISKQLDKKAGKKFKSEPASGVGFMNAEGAGGYDVTKNKLTLNDDSCPEAQLWNGWKSHGLKPAYEPILVAMKPNDGTYVNNALKHGVSGLNIDGGMIPFKSEADKQSAVFGRGTDIMGGNYVGATHGTGETNIQPNNKGRYPANVILDEEAAAMLDEQSGVLQSSSGNLKFTNRNNPNGIYSKYNPTSTAGISDSGGASRFFYCAKASKSERNAGCKGLEAHRPGGGGFGLAKNPMASHDKSRAEMHGKATNHHPTVKPLALMEYLCRLTKTPTGGVVLDPFAGSGTTCVACVNEGRDFIGIEKESEYVEIARRRIKWAQEQRKEKMGLFAERSEK